jgi:segregation and condensation protein A
MHEEHTVTEPAATEPESRLVVRPVYQVRIAAFEGPLDLLLHLIRSQELDIYDIPIAQITDQYLEYLGFMESLDLSLAGEFLEMAATLIRIKVRMLLPAPEKEGEEEEDPRQDLVRRLVEYREFKEAAKQLSEQELERREHHPRAVDITPYLDDEPDTEELLRDVTLFDLVDALREVLSRVPHRVDVHSVDLEEVTVEERIDYLERAIGRGVQVRFTELFEVGATRARIIATFIALLELIKRGVLAAVQERVFSDIVITAAAEEGS